MKKSLSPSSLFNLFSKGDIPESPKLQPRLKAKKKEIQLVFHHPNLLYLSSKKEKTQQEISREIEQKIIQRIQKHHKDSNKDYWRPHTTNGISRKINNFVSDSENRCKTAEETKTLRKRSYKAAIQVQGNSSTFSGPFFQKTNNRTFQRKSTTKTEAMSNTISQFKVEPWKTLSSNLSGSEKHEIWRRLLSNDECKAELRLNMCLDVQKKYLKYNTKKIKTAEKIKHSQTYLV